MSKNAQDEKQQAVYRAALDKLLQDPANKVCSDCMAAGPRWASPKLGIFICMKCAGIHRGLGVHISFVRSVTLDKWKSSEVEDMHPGNAAAAAIYEATLPSNFPRPSADGIALEKFIRNKYVYRRYVPENGSKKVTVPAPVSPPVTRAVPPPVQPQPFVSQPLNSVQPKNKFTQPGNLTLFDIPAVAPPQKEPPLKFNFGAPEATPPGRSNQEEVKSNIMQMLASQNQFPQVQQNQFPQVQQTGYLGQPYMVGGQVGYAQNYQTQALYPGMQQMPQGQGQVSWGNGQLDSGGLEILSKIQTKSQEQRGNLAW